MGLHQIRKLLHLKEKSYQNEEIIHRMGENLCKPYLSGKELISRIFEDLKLSTSRTHNLINSEKMI
jgi:hypothetical protein